MGGAALLWWAMQPRPQPRATADQGLRALAPPDAPRTAAPEPWSPPAATEPPAPEPPAPQREAGTALTVTLAEPPALRYLEAPGSDSDSHYRSLIDDLSDGRAVYDAALSRAARELVYQSTEVGDVVPSDVREFVVRSAGAVAADSHFQQLRTTGDGPEALRQAISDVLKRHPARDAGVGVLHIGVGEVYRPGAKLPRHIGVLGTQLGVELTPFAARIAAGSTWTLRGRLTRPWQHLTALVLRQDGSLAELEVRQQGDQIAVDVPAGQAAGYLDVDLDGEGPHGPGKLLQVRAWVERDPPRSYTTHLPADESGLGQAADAEGWAFGLLNADRHAAGLAPLQWDGELAAIARRHSEDMRDHGFFAHKSPQTGLPGDRLRAADYRAPRFAENIALNSTLHEAEQGLLHSLGHRKNILTRDMDRVGLGVAMQGEGKSRRWWLTQLFAKQASQLPVAELQRRIGARLSAWRASQGKPTPTADAALAEVATAAAAYAAAGHLDSASSHALELAKSRGLVRGRLLAWAVLTADPEQFDWPESLQQDTLHAWGAGVAAAQGYDGRHAVVLLMAP